MLVRPIWNDGQALTTPELQRPCDLAAYADDRVLESLLNLGTLPDGATSPRKAVLPFAKDGDLLSTTLQNSRVVYTDSTNSAPQLVQCLLAHIKGSSDPLPGTIQLSARLDKALTGPNITANSSGVTRYDLVYATINRTTPLDITAPPASAAFAGVGKTSPGTGAQQNRKIKSVSSGIIASQLINIYDVPTITLSVVTGFLTGATPPTLVQCQSALPADSSSASSFALAYITLASGYTVGSLTQSMITQVWQTARIPTHRLQQNFVPSLYSSAVAQKPTTPISERWAGMRQMFFNFLVKTGTPVNIGSGFIIDNTIDWRHRMLIIMGGEYSAGSGGQAIEGATLIPCALTNQSFGTIGQGLVYVTGEGDTAGFEIRYNSSATAAFIGVNSIGNLVGWVSGTPANGSTGDLIAGLILFSDPLVF